MELKHNHIYLLKTYSPEGIVLPMRYWVKVVCKNNNLIDKDMIYWNEWKKYPADIVAVTDD